MEQPTEGRAFYQRGCACNSSSTSDLPIVYTSSSRALEVRFTAINMTAHDDPDSLNFEATYEFIKLPLLCKEVKKLNATSGNINVADENVSLCFAGIFPRKNFSRGVPLSKYYLQYIPIPILPIQFAIIRNMYCQVWNNCVLSCAQSVTCSNSACLCM